MRRAELIERGIKPDTVDSMEIDVTRAVVEEEFLRQSTSNGYRFRAIDRLVEMLVPFSSDVNLLGDLLKRYVHVTCPYCGNEMNVKSQGGTSDRWRLDFTCACLAKASLSLTGDGLSFDPGSVQEIESNWQRALKAARRAWDASTGTNTAGTTFILRKACEDRDLVSAKRAVIGAENAARGAGKWDGAYKQAVTDCAAALAVLSK